MAYTTVPTISITLVIFIILGFTQSPTGDIDTTALLGSIDEAFNINLWLFLVPAAVIFLIVKRTKPLIALLAGTLLGGLFAIIFQPDIVAKIAGTDSLSFTAAYKGVMQAMTVDTAIETSNAELNDLFSASGMSGMLGTIWLIICALVFGGIMEAIGALSRISGALLQLTDSIFGLFASTVASCLAINFTASDQYLAIVVPGKMFSKAYEEKGLAPENLSRTLEDSGTVTSVLVPWNTCGAYQSSVLGVSVFDYFAYAIFNYLSPFMTLLFAAFKIKIKMLKEGK
jgi:NhaC family Na+:H+ antiporter